MMAEWRFARGWSESELERRLEAAQSSQVGFSTSADGAPIGHAWRRYYTEAVIGLEAPGPPAPGGAFERCWEAIQQYQFSDPGIVMAHYDPREPLMGRTLLLEIKVLGLHYLCGTRINAVRDGDRAATGTHAGESRSVRGFRYDTLEGHLEIGSEWFLLTQDHATGEIRFRIHASWLPGEFPNWWSRMGFGLLSERYQLAWHRLAYLRLRELAGPARFVLDPVPVGRALVHAGSDVKDSELWILKARSASLQVGVLGQPKKKLGENHHERLG